MENSISAAWRDARTSIFEQLPVLYFAEWFQAAWCRVVHGHVMAKVGEGHNGTLYQCARCPMVELLKTLD